MGSQNRGIIIQKNNGFTELRYYNTEKTMGSQNRGIIKQKSNGFTEQRYYKIEKQWVHRIEIL